MTHLQKKDGFMFTALDWDLEMSSCLQDSLCMWPNFSAPNL